MSKSIMRRSLSKALKSAALFIFLPALLSALVAKLFLIYNYTPSIPTGWYVIYPCVPNMGDIVVFDGPISIRMLAEQRGYIKPGMKLMKPVAATARDVVCIQNQLVTINGSLVAKALQFDGRGEPMPKLNLCHTLGKGEIFVLATEWDKSLDGRYFGAIMSEEIRGCGMKIW